MPNSVAVHAIGGTVRGISPDGSVRWHGTLPDGDRLTAPLAPALNSMVYIRGRHDLHAYGSDGRWLWKRQVSALPPKAQPALFAPAAMADSSVVIRVEAKELRAFEPDGSPRWDLKLPDGELAAPVVGASNGQLIAPTTAGLYGISPRGEILWRQSASGAAPVTPPQSAPPPPPAPVQGPPAAPSVAAMASAEPVPAAASVSSK